MRTSRSSGLAVPLATRGGSTIHMAHRVGQCFKLVGDVLKSVLLLAMGAITGPVRTRAGSWTIWHRDLPRKYWGLSSLRAEDIEARRSVLTEGGIVRLQGCNEGGAVHPLL